MNDVCIIVSILENDYAGTKAYRYKECLGITYEKYKRIKMKNADKPTADLDELKKVIGPEALADILPEEPKYRIKGGGHQRTKFNVTQQGLQTKITKAFYEWLPEAHKTTIMQNHTRYKFISPEATSIWILLEKHKLDLTVDYKTLYDFSKL